MDSLSFHQAFLSILKGLELPRKDASELKRELSYHFVRLSTAVRDFTIDISVSRFEPDDIRVMRNLTQGVIRALLSIQSDTILFNIQVNPLAEGLRDGKLQDQPRDLSVEDEKRLIVTLVADFLTKPTRKMLDAMTACLDSCDSVMLTIGGQQKLQVSNNPQSLSMCLQVLQKSVEGFDAADDALVDRPEMVSGSGYQEVVKLFLFVHPIRQAADKIRMLTRHIYAMEQKHRGWWLQLPSYPYKKSLNRTNAQVRHDRGGLTAGFYFRTKTQLEKTIEELHSRSYVPAARHEVGQSKQKSSQAGETTGAAMNSKVNKAKKQGLRYRIWVALHRLQGFESRFAFKVVVVTTLLSVPAWLDQSRGWWNDNEIWWAVVTVWLMTHPRVSGTSHDLAVRIFYVLLGSVWGALSYRAGSGNPYVVAIFAAVFMIPMLHRYTQSAHPRSGVIGCISFTVISLSTYTSGGNPSVTQIAWTRGLAFAAATLASVLVNWILWPFVARHELRKSISAMMLHLAILYRGVVSRYVYYSKDDEPGPQDIARSEMLEGRLREGFVRIRQLMELTQHEIVSRETQNVFSLCLTANSGSVPPLIPCPTAPSLTQVLNCLKISSKSVNRASTSALLILPVTIASTTA